jgi:hypothetical protein
VLGVEHERRAEAPRLRGRRPPAGEPLEQRRRDRPAGPACHRPAGGEVHPGREQGGRLADEPLRLAEQEGPGRGRVVALDETDVVAVALDVLRLRLASGTLTKTEDYMEMAQLETIFLVFKLL